MNRATFVTLTPQQQHTLMVSVRVRNAMEEFHVKHLSDAQMAELNPIIRQAIFDAVNMIEDSSDPAYSDRIGHIIDMIPEYWEIPVERSESGRKS